MSQSPKTTAGKRRGAGLQRSVKRLVAWLDDQDTILPDDHTPIPVPATMLRDLRKWVDENG